MLEFFLKNTLPGLELTACPTCAKMLDDAVKIEGLDDRLEVLSIAEIVMRSR